MAVSWKHGNQQNSHAAKDDAKDGDRTGYLARFMDGLASGVNEAYQFVRKVGDVRVLDPFKKSPAVATV